MSVNRGEKPTCLLEDTRDRREEFCGFAEIDEKIDVWAEAIRNGEIIIRGDTTAEEIYYDKAISTVQERLQEAVNDCGVTVIITRAADKSSAIIISATKNLQ